MVVEAPYLKKMNIRLAVQADACAIAEIYRPIVASTPISFEIEPPDEQEMARRIDHKLLAFPWLVCESEGQIAGYAYGSTHRPRAAYQWSVETSVYVHSVFRRRGIAKGLYVSLLRILAAQGYFTAFAGITLPNPGSVKLHETVGFKPIGSFRDIGYKLGRWHDVGWWQLALRPHIDPPGPALALDECRRLAEWSQMLLAGLEHIHEGS
jgi:phosphinothricin acetyltransferase